MEEPIVNIHKMAFGGAGFGHIEGKACFVPFTAPGDIARIRVKVNKRSYMEGELVELIEPSPDRTTPPCPVFGSCGGCNWQHLPYPAQLKAKEEIFAELLWRSARVERDVIEPIIPAPDPFGYRSRIQIKVRLIGDCLHMGFYREGSHFVVDIPGRCVIADTRINRLLDGLRRVIASAPEPDKVPQVDMAIGGDGRSEMVVHYIGDRRDETTRHLINCNASLGADTILLQRGRKNTLEKVCEKGGPLAYEVPAPFLTESPDYRLEICSGGFSQVNYRQNLRLIEIVCSWAALTGKERVLDVYCGNGNFSLPLSGRSASLLGIEDFGPSIASARRNCEVNGVTNAAFECADALKAMERLTSRGEIFDLVLLDPPRMGAREVVGKIAELGPTRVIYVSCDPATLARDLGILKKSGYGVVRCRPFDMFPQTYHMESVTLLEIAP